MFNWVLDVPLKEIVSNLIKKVLAKAIPPAITCSKLTIEILEQGVRYVQSYNNKGTWCRSGVFLLNFEHISYLVIVFLLLPLNR